MLSVGVAGRAVAAVSVVMATPASSRRFRWGSGIGALTMAERKPVTLRRIIRAFAGALSLLVSAGGAWAGDLHALYPRDALERDGQRLENAVRKIYDLGIAPTLADEEKARLGNVEFSFPMPRPGDDPMNFYAYRKDRRAIVVMPVLSLKSVEDMATAYAWVHTARHALSTIDLYYAMLRHRPPERFPGGRYVDILKALSVPPNALDDPRVDRLSLSLRNEAFAFILVHELGHVLFEHKGYGEVSRERARADEMQSDRFALDVLARSGTPPMGAVLYFQAQVYRFQHRGEFAEEAAWQDYLMKVATHPMTVDRLRAMARHIAGPLAEKRGREKAAWIGIGAQLGEVATILEDPDLQKCIARSALELPLEALNPRIRNQAKSLLDVCARK